jgi:hypothetical protein
LPGALQSQLESRDPSITPPSGQLVRRGSQKSHFKSAEDDFGEAITTRPREGKDISEYGGEPVLQCSSQQPANVVESELILLGTDYDNEGKPIAYLGREAEGQLQFAGTAFLTLAGKPRDDLQKRIAKLLTTRPPVPQRTWRKPQWGMNASMVTVDPLQLHADWGFTGALRRDEGVSRWFHASPQLSQSPAPMTATIAAPPLPPLSSFLPCSFRCEVPLRH